MAKIIVNCWPNLRFTKHDLIALCLAILIPVTVIILTLVSVLPSLGAPPLPDFGDPVKGFEPRGTKLSDQIVTMQNFYDKLQDGTILQFEPFQGSSGGQVQQVSPSVKRKRRSTQGSLDPPLLSGQVYNNMIFVFESSNPEETMFDADKLKTACAMESDILSASSAFKEFCYGITDGTTGIKQCYSSSSLGNYVALLNNHKSCQDITDDDVSMVKNLLLNCSSYFLDQSLKSDCDPSTSGGNASSTCSNVPAECIKYNAVYNIFNYLTDNEMSPSNDMFLKYAASLPAGTFDEDFVFDELYNSQLKEAIPARKGVEFASFKFSRYKFDLFGKKVISEVIYPALAMIVVFFIMWFFLGSFILTFCGLFTIIYAFGLSYFLYTRVFQLDFFPFLNVTTLVFLVGIGADDAFVYYDIWRQTRAANPNANIMQLTLKTLRYAAVSMLVTSLTTASAFFAGVSSTITPIRLFGIFAGTSILTNYLLMITYFPACVALHEKWVLKYTGGQSLDVVSPTELKADQEGTELEQVAPTAQDMSENRNEADLPVKRDNTQKETSLCILQVIDFPCSLLESATNFTGRVGKKIFEDWLPKAVIKLYWLWIALLVCLTAGFLCVNFVKPGLQLPNSKDFQVFAASHPLENYYLNYKSYFRFEQQSRGLWVELIWGIKPTDNGNYLNPDDKGTLEFDNNFKDLFTPDSQKFLRSVCQSVEKQSFFQAFSFGRCPIETFIDTCTSEQTPCCGVNATFPFPANVTENCVKLASRLVTTGVLFDGLGNVKGFRMVIITNQQFSTSFNAMDDFWKKVSSWVDTEMPKAPQGMQSGWAGCWGLDFYALQIGLSDGTYSSLGISVVVSFAVMLLTTLNIFISIYAIITIIGIIAITIGSLVLAGWQLNILESIVMSVAVGLSIDFTMHYGVAYRLAPDKSQRVSRVRYSLVHIGSAITMAAITTFLTGLMMMPSTVLAYFQLGQFLMLVMVFSWLYSTFGFLSICTVIGPREDFGQLSISRLFRKCGPCRVKPEDSKEPVTKSEIVDLNEDVVSDLPPEKQDQISTHL
ncbi:protein dispatched homolog 1-like [Oculina patagonica]